MNVATSSNGLRYAELDSRLRTGDVLLFHGDSPRSKIIEGATRSEFSHAGMIVRAHTDKPPLLWHSDPRPVAPDAKNHSMHGGAQVNELPAALAVMTSPDYGDTPFVRHLIVERTPEFEHAAQKAIAALDGTSFPSLLKILQEWLLGRLHIRTSKRRMYCAEVLAETYQRMGLLPTDPPANGYAPRDFSEHRTDLPLLRGARFGPEIQVLWP